MMNTKDVVNFGLNSGTYVAFATAYAQVEDILKIVSLILSIIVSACLIVAKIVDWYNKAKADGKIDSKEIKEGVNIIVDGANDIKEQIEKGTNKDENKK